MTMKKTIFAAAVLIAAGNVHQAAAQMAVTDSDRTAQALTKSITLPDLCGAAGTVEGDVAQVVGMRSRPEPDERAFITLKCGDGSYRGIKLVDPLKYVPPALPAK
jgi:hypothetical protein